MPQPYLEAASPSTTRGHAMLHISLATSLQRTYYDAIVTNNKQTFWNVDSYQVLNPTLAFSLKACPPQSIYENSWPDTFNFSLTMLLISMKVLTFKRSVQVQYTTNQSVPEYVEDRILILVNRTP